MPRQRMALTATWLVVLVVGVATYVQMRSQPFFYDASDYVAAAQGISDNGVLSRWSHSDIRTYGYPLFLTAAIKIANWLNVGLSTGVFLLQWPLYVGSAWLAARTLYRSDRIRLAAFALLAANPLLVVYTADALTESLSVSCLLLAVAAMGRSFRTDSPRSMILLLAAGGAASSFAMVVRPGNVLVPACYALGAVTLLLRRHDRRVLGTALAATVVVSAALLAPLVPQVVINHRNYHKISAIPVYDLTGLQTRAGLQYIRYATNVSTECGHNSLFFLNPHVPPLDVTTTEAVRYYTLGWPEGPETAALHVFSAFDPRPFLTYQLDFGAGYERWLQAFTVALLFLAGLGTRTAWEKLRGADRRFRLDAAFLGLVTAMSLGIVAMSAAEYRYGVIPIATVSLLAALGLARLRRPTWWSGCAAAACYFAALLLWFALSDLVLATSTTWQQCR